MSPRVISSVPAINSAPSALNDTLELFYTSNSDFPSALEEFSWSPEGYWFFLSSSSNVKYSSSLRGPWTDWALPAALGNTSGRAQYVNGYYMVGDGTNNSNVPLYFSTTIGGSWSTRTSGVTGGHRKYIWHESSSNWVHSGPSSFFTYSPAPMTTTSWTTRVLGSVGRCCGTNGTNIIICDNAGVMRTATDPAGTFSNVSNSSFGTTGINDIEYDGPVGAKIWVAVGDAGKIAYTTTANGSTGWTQLTALGTDNLGRIAYHRGRWIARPDAAVRPYISSSADLSTATWTRLSLDTDATRPTQAWFASNGLMLGVVGDSTSAGGGTYGVSGSR